MEKQKGFSKIFWIIVVSAIIIIIAGGILTYYFLTKSRAVKQSEAEKPTAPYITPMSVLDPLGVTAGTGEPKIENFEK